MSAYISVRAWQSVSRGASIVETSSRHALAADLQRPRPAAMRVSTCSLLLHGMGLVDSLAASSAFNACGSEVQREHLPSMTDVPIGAAVPMRSPAKRRRVALRLYTLAASRHVSGGRGFCLRTPCYSSDAACLRYHSYVVHALLKQLTRQLGYEQDAGS